MLAVVTTLFGGTSAAQAAGDRITFTATLNGRDVAGLTNNDPLVLHPGTSLVVSLVVTNHGSSATTIPAARLNGRVMGLSFFNYDTQIGLKVPVGATVRTRFSLGLTDLGGQADGRLPATVSLLDSNADEIATHPFTVDVKGKLTSIYGIFGLAIIGITALWLLSLIYRLVTRTLPANRWSRAVQFSAAGFGVGLTLTFSVSVLRLLTPSAVVWAPFVLGAGLIGFAVGYITPGPRPRDDEDDDEQFAAEHAARQRALAPVGASSQAFAGGAVPPAVGGEAPNQLDQPAPPAGSGPQQQGAEPSRPVVGRRDSDTTVEADRSQLDQMFGREYGSGEPGRS